jgi:hypothetical protein
MDDHAEHFSKNVDSEFVSINFDDETLEFTSETLQLTSLSSGSRRSSIH